MNTVKKKLNDIDETQVSEIILGKNFKLYTI